MNELSGALVVILTIHAVTFGTGCEDNPAPHTAHAAHGGTHAERVARAKAAAAKPAKRYESFDLHVDRAPFLAAGCVSGRDDRHLDCRAAPFGASFGCAPDMLVEDLLGGLVAAKATIAIAECRVAGDAGLAKLGCRAPAARRYVVWNDGNFDLVASPETFRKRFGPAKTAASALGFALAHARDARARFDLTFPDEGQVEPDTLPTNVLPRPRGWVVRLFERKVCGCSHPDEAVDWLVTRDGEVSEIARSRIHVDPATEGACAD